MQVDERSPHVQRQQQIAVQDDDGEDALSQLLSQGNRYEDDMQ